MSSHNITISLADPSKEQPLSHRDFEIEHDFQDSPENTFYVAQDASGKIHGTVMINGSDRKATGALVGNWIASGLAVNRMPYKALNKVLRAQDAASKERESESNMVAPASSSTPEQFNSPSV